MNRVSSLPNAIETMMKAATFSLALTLLLAAAPAADAQTQPQEAAVNEAVYRQANRITLRQRLSEARAAQDRRDLPAAAKLYIAAWELVQKIGSGVDAERDQTVAGLAAVQLELARAAQRRGDYKQALERLTVVLNVDPTNAAAVDLKSANEKLLAEQRGTIPSEEVQSQVPALAEDRIKASTLVHDGKLLYEMGKLDEADIKLKQALRQDPHNEAALYYLNIVSEAKFLKSAKLHEVTMRQDIRAVEQAWANPVQRELLPVPNPYARTNMVHTGQGRQTIIAKLDRIRLDTTDLKEIMNVRKRFRLDFDDAYQYVAAEKHDLTLVSFDADFDRTDRGRKTPADILGEPPVARDKPSTKPARRRSRKP